MVSGFLVVRPPWRLFPVRVLLFRKTLIHLSLDLFSSRGFSAHFLFIGMVYLWKPIDRTPLRFFFLRDHPFPPAPSPSLSFETGPSSLPQSPRQFLTICVTSTMPTAIVFSCVVAGEASFPLTASPYASMVCGGCD